MEQVDAFMADCGESGKKRPAVAIDAVNKLQEIKDSSERAMLTKSTGLYEPIMMDTDQYTDELDIAEGWGNRLLNQYQSGLANAVDSVKKSFADTPDIDSKKVQTKLFLPERLLNNMPQRGFGAVVEEAVYNYTLSAYHSRLDRIKAKNDLLNYLENDVEPEHRVIVDLIENKASSDTYEFGALLRVLDDSDSYWDEFDSVYEIVSSEKWDYIKQGQDRIEALEEYYERVYEADVVEKLPATYQDIYDDIERAYGASRPTKRDHARSLDLYKFETSIIESVFSKKEQEQYYDIIEDVAVNDIYKLTAAQNQKNVIVKNTDVVEFCLEQFEGYDVETTTVSSSNGATTTQYIISS
jgi:hypothetical protein